jgi:hypothetical protein
MISQEGIFNIMFASDDFKINAERFTCIAGILSREITHKRKVIADGERLKVEHLFYQVSGIAAVFSAAYSYDAVEMASLF